MIMNSLPLEDGFISLRCELRGTNCEAHISTLMSSKDTVTVINKLGKDGLAEVVESSTQKGLTSTKGKDREELLKTTFWEFMEN